ncbi:unnamed protein product [Closterium sp. Yama58-4]|nr:unnamed protein product [Closterium sp. Yama58-4]
MANRLPMRELVVPLSLLLLVASAAMQRAAAQPALDYRDALAKSILFFEGQRSGRLDPRTNRVPWRGSSGLQDGARNNVDLVGGYYDAGDNVKFGFPMAFTVTMLSWAVVEYGAQLQAAGQLRYALDAIRWGTDYFLKANTGPTELWGQVGDPNSDHACWQRPEDMTTDRTAYKIDAQHPGSDLAGETAAALAAASIAFRGRNNSYANTLLSHARQSLQFPTAHLNAPVRIPHISRLLCSLAARQDELLWAAAWLYRATGDEAYLQYIQRNDAQLGGSTQQLSEFSWDNKYAGAQLLLTERSSLNAPSPLCLLLPQLLLSGRIPSSSSDLFNRYRRNAEFYVCSNMPNNPLSRTPRTPGKNTNPDHAPGNHTYIAASPCSPPPLRFLQHSAPLFTITSLCYVTNMAFLTTVLADTLQRAGQNLQCASTTFTPQQLLAEARRQVDYILGRNPQGVSYMVGFSSSFPQRIHHRGASIPSIFTAPQQIGCSEGFRYLTSPSPNPNVHVGAIVGGPRDGVSAVQQSDTYADDRTDYSTAEPATYINPGMVGALARIVGGGSSSGQPPSSPPPPGSSSPPPPLSSSPPPRSSSPPPPRSSSPPPPRSSSPPPPRSSSPPPPSTTPSPPSPSPPVTPSPPSAAISRVKRGKGGASRKAQHVQNFFDVCYAHAARKHAERLASGSAGDLNGSASVRGNGAGERAGAGETAGGEGGGVGDSLFAALRLMTPSLDRERGSYGVREAALGRCVADAIGLARDSEEARKLEDWQKGGRVHVGENAGNFVEVAMGVESAGELTIAGVNALLDDLVAAGPREAKVAVVDRMIHATNPTQLKWILLIILQGLHFGMSERSVLRAFHPDAEDVFNHTCDLRRLCHSLPSRALRAKRQDIEPGSAVRPQLARRVDTAEAAWSLMKGKEAVVECKFDGDRVQIHKHGHAIHFFSRNFKEHPEFLHGMKELVEDNILTHKCILDGEMLAWDRVNNKFVEFGSNQTAAKEARDGSNSDIQLCYVAFDILYHGDGSVIHHPLKHRHQLLKEVVHPVPHRLELLLPPDPRSSNVSPRAPGEPNWSQYAHSAADIQAFFVQTVDNRDEGVVVKDLQSPWEAGDRSSKWLKLKPDYMDTGADIDALVMGAYFGSNRRGGELSQFLLGLWEQPPDPDQPPPRLLSFCRVGGGMSDDDLGDLRERLLPVLQRNERGQPPPSLYAVTNHAKERPDVWVSDPTRSVVLQIRGDIRVIQTEVFQAPRSLRFPRVTRIRHDKPWWDSLDLPDMVSVPPGVQQRAVQQQVVRHGGVVSANLSPAVTHAVAHSASGGFRLKAAVKAGDVYTYEWLQECLQARKLVPPKPKHYLHRSLLTAQRQQQQVDKFGDSYTDDIADVLELKQLFAKVAESQVKAVPSGDLEVQRRKLCVESGAVHTCIFQGVVLFVLPCLPTLHQQHSWAGWQHVSEVMAGRRAALEVAMGGGTVEARLSTHVTHVLLPCCLASIRHEDVEATVKLYEECCPAIQECSDSDGGETGKDEDGSSTDSDGAGDTGADADADDSDGGEEEEDEDEETTDDEEGGFEAGGVQEARLEGVDAATQQWEGEMSVCEKRIISTEDDVTGVSGSQSLVRVTPAKSLSQPRTVDPGTRGAGEACASELKEQVQHASKRLRGEEKHGDAELVGVPGDTDQGSREVGKEGSLEKIGKEEVMGMKSVEVESEEAGNRGAVGNGSVRVEEQRTGEVDTEKIDADDKTNEMFNFFFG